MVVDIVKNLAGVLLFEIFRDEKQRKQINCKSLITVCILAGLHFVSNYEDMNEFKTVLPLVEIIVLFIYGYLTCVTSNVRQIYTAAVEAYVSLTMIGFVLGPVMGALSWLFRRIIYIENEFVIVVCIWTIIVFMMCKYFHELKKYAQNTTTSIVIILGAFVLFFQSFFRIAFGEHNYSFGIIITLLLYLTMIFTAFMLLQHNRLTAKQQAIEEDNRQMSQRLHRSKDVLGVVSQVVASEDHIDPKLRKELADFCDDEMNEMQDRALGANLIGDTGIELVNVMLQKQMMRCADLNISFDVMIPAPIDGYIREIGISATEFMRMLNDLLKNAVKEILSSDNTHRELLLIMGEAGNDCFEIRLYDSGVPFPPKILEHLGERGNTTDGTGNGIADTVETLRHYRASFVIEPIEPGTDIYTKCIHIAFDGQGCLPQNGEQ